MGNISRNLPSRRSKIWTWKRSSTSFAVDWYQDLWEDIAGETPQPQSPAESEQRPTTDTWGLDNPPAASDFGIMPYAYEGPNWQDEGATDTITVTERRCLSTNCPFCQHDFTNGQFVAKYRCGHAVCTDCYDNAIHHGWFRCTLCRRSGTTRYSRVIVIPGNNNGGNNDGDDNDGDVTVFIHPGNTTTTEPVASSSDDFVPRHIVVKNLIKHHRAEMDKFDNAIDQLIDQLLINRNKRDEHKQHLKELEK